VNEPVLSCLVLVGDSARDAPETLQNLAKAMFKLIDPGVDTRPARLRFDPPTSSGVARICHAERWKSTAPGSRKDLVDLFRTIATYLLREDGFVVFHLDADVPWGSRATSVNVERF